MVLDQIAATVKDELFSLQEYPLDSCSPSCVPGPPDHSQIFSLPASSQPEFIPHKTQTFALLFAKFLEILVSLHMKVPEGSSTLLSQQLQIRIR